MYVYICMHISTTTTAGCRFNLINVCIYLYMHIGLTRYIYYIYIYIHIYPGGTPLQKSFKIRSWVPSPQMPYFNKTQVTCTTHTTQEPPHHRTTTPPNTRTKHTTNHLATIGRKNLTPQRLERIPPGFGLVGIIIRDRNNFAARAKAQ